MANIIIAGVGGQGSLLASRVLGAYYTGQGLDVKVSEVHGMSQRGGSVVTFVRAGEKVFSPLVSEGEADCLVAFEELEALRYMHYLKKDGVLAVNIQHIAPMPVITGREKYPGDIPDRMRAAGFSPVLIDALTLAREAGSFKATNLVMIGALAAVAGFCRTGIENAVRKVVPERFLELNLKAFDLGYQKAAD